jgi:hypothetical protein
VASKSAADPGCGAILLAPGCVGLDQIRGFSSLSLESVLTAKPFGERSGSDANLSTSEHGAEERYLCD